MYRSKSGHLRRLIGSRDISELQDISVMQGYIKQRLEEGAAKTTLRKELVTMRQALYAALEAKRIKFDPRICFPRFRAPYRPKERWLTPDEFLRLLLAFNAWREGDDPALKRQGSPHRQLWLVIAVYTGGRDSEVDGLRWEDIDWKARMIHIRGTKTKTQDVTAGSDRLIPLQPVLASVLARSRQPTGYIVGEWCNVRRDLHAACSRKRANIPPCSPNDLRRTFASWLANMGVSEGSVSKLLGHGSSQMVRKVYARLERSLMAREIALLSGSCVTGVPNSGADQANEATVSQESLGKLAEMLTNTVLEPRVELGTRGFSVRIPSKKSHRNLVENEARAISAPAKRRGGRR
jgi:integrase